MADPFYVQSNRYILVRFLCKKMRLELTSLHLSDIASCWASAILLSSWVNWWWLVDLEYNLYKMLTHWLCSWTNQYMTNSRCEYNRVVSASLCNTNKYLVTFTPETISMWKYRLAFSHFQLLAFSHFQLLACSHFYLLAFSHFQLLAFSHFQLLACSHFHLLAFSQFQLLACSHFQLLACSHFHLLAFSHFQLLACSQLDATHFQLLAFSHFQLYQQILYHLFSFYMLWNINQGLKFLWQENWT